MFEIAWKDRNMQKSAATKKTIQYSTPISKMTDA